MNRTSASLKIGNTAELEITSLLPETALDQEIVFETTNPKVCDILYKDYYILVNIYFSCEK